MYNPVYASLCVPGGVPSPYAFLRVPGGVHSPYTSLCVYNGGIHPVCLPVCTTVVYTLVCLPVYLCRWYTPWYASLCTLPGVYTRYASLCVTVMEVYAGKRPP